MGAQFVTSLLIFVIGMGVGVLLQRYVLGRRHTVSKLESELTKLKNEHLQIQESLRQHFDETANLAHAMTDSYKALYDHLAKGAGDFTQKPLADLDAILESKPSLTSSEPKDYVEDELTDAELADAGLVRESSSRS